MKIFLSLFFVGFLYVFPILKAPEINMPPNHDTIVPISISGNGIHNLHFDYEKDEADFNGFVPEENLEANCFEYEYVVHCEVSARFGETIPTGNVILLRLSVTEDQPIILTNVEFFDINGICILGNSINGYIRIFETTNLKYFIPLIYR